MRIFGLMTAAIVVGLLSPANAADMPVKASLHTAPAAAPYNWAGFYAGIQGGYGWGPSRFYNEGGNNLEFGSYTIRGGAFGGTLGYNYQMGLLVFGIEGDGSWANINDTATTVICGPCITKVGPFGTLRGRLGYAFDRFLPYVTGGVAVGRLEGSLPGLIGLSPVTSVSTTRVGYAVGGGLEAALAGEWSAKAEYIYMDLGRAGFPVGVGSDYTVGRVNLFRVGLNYHFGR